MKETMTERFQFRLTKTLLQAIERRAERLGITAQSVVRYAVAIDVSDVGENYIELAGNEDGQGNKNETA